MSFVGQILADGQVSNTEGALYTAPASTVAYIRFMSFTNTGVVDETLILYVRKGAGTSRKIFQGVIEPDYTITCDDAISLGATDSIRAETTNSSVVDFLITGAEEV